MTECRLCGESRKWILFFTATIKLPSILFVFRLFWIGGLVLVSFKGDVFVVYTLTF